MVKCKRIYQNIAYFSFMFFISLKAIKEPVSLSLATQEGRKTNKIFAGEPFRLIVDFNQKGPEYFDKVILQNQEKLTILDKSIVQQISRSMSRKSEKKQYVFLLRCDIVGPLTLGPVVFEGKRDALSTGLITIDVQEPDMQSNEAAPVFLKAEVGQKDLYVGQKVPIDLSFYSRSQTAEEFSLFLPESTEALKIIGKSEPVESTQKRDQDVYNVISWRIDAAPQQPGVIVLPSVRGLYKEAVGPFSFMGFLEARNAYSNAAVFNVKPIPKFNGVIDAVGKFTTFYVEVDKTQVQVNQALVYRCVLTGETDFSALESLRIKLPEDIKFFKSAKKLISFKGVQETVGFEYVLQPKKDGEFIIPVQEFVFFDPDVKSFKKLQTRPIKILVTPAPIVKKLEMNENFEQEVKQGLDTVLFKKLPINAKSKPELPIWLIVLLSISSLLWAVWPWLIGLFQRCIIKPRKVKTAFFIAKKEFDIIFKIKRSDKLYPLFMNLFSLRLNQSYNILNQSFIHSVLYQRGVEKELLEKWEEFYKIIERCYYSPELKVNDQVFVDGRMWLNELEKYI